MPVTLELKNIVTPQKTKCSTENCWLGHIAPLAGNPRSDTVPMAVIVRFTHIIMGKHINNIIISFLKFIHSWCIHLSLAGYMEAYSYLVYTVWVVVALMLNWTPNLRQVPSKKLLKIKYKVSDWHVSQP